MEVSEKDRDDVTGSAGRRSLGGLGWSAGPDGRVGHVSAKAVAETLAILMMDLVGVLPISDRTAVLERLTNRLDEQGRTPGGRETAALLGSVAVGLMGLEV
ncbi:hypothetical protein [Methylobacterium gnaphalii]|uniref:Uncharacterized protein n=1 Tax=Methylobacterium gnaphalii TaxID=1010610 RepID=A0A512JF50_9HYPH|nr:hypothetical protein [Methylobacterium gnaphalii]GEP08575.1 hypothetical protein MGN01_04200 [Methylobacterium gnaphalii]GJD70589.1 hypothetical protein MMMDOFMJ_3538 [Methylobacterium gnaphalii]GLS50792.1 hypothetical protein GCM10007885_36460 [Methylobacterium gnaphalii]